MSNDTGASSTDGVTSDNTLVFGGTAEANATVTLSRSGLGVIGTTTASSSGVWIFELQRHDHP
ncbi:MAG: Ig-like domain-containing protein [Nibricoccus sp.]